ncbi:MAG: glycerate kinase [Desulfobacterales bacterium]|nr:glycerate kinase [Desulfobacterales bacterium]
MTLNKFRDDAYKIFKSALKEVDPYSSVKKSLTLSGDILKAGNRSYNISEYSKIRLLGAGKASGRMALAVEEILSDKLSKGLVIVKYNHTELLSKTEIIEAGHPVPDKKGEEGAQKLLDYAKKADHGTLIIFLVSGGGSALTPLPLDNISLDQKQQITIELLNSGATIHEINTIRKKLSKIKGGKFVEISYPATVLSLILSDVVGDDLDIIASGMTVPDKSTHEDCLRILKKYGLEKKIPVKILKLFKKNEINRSSLFDRSSIFLIGKNYDALKAAKSKAEKLGYNTLILSSTIEGNTKSVAHIHCEIAKQIIKTGDPVKTPACIISGGETTVNVTGNGMGGRNQEFALECVEKISGFHNILIFSAGTDGTDGPTHAAGAIADSKTLKEGIEKGLNHNDFLKRNDSYNYFKPLNNLIMTGPTKTNVMDIKIILVR